MEENNKIPQAVIKMANEMSCNKIEYIGHIEGYGVVYSIWAEDENGIPIPLGLPLYVIQRGSNLSLFSDVNFELSDLLAS